LCNRPPTYIHVCARMYVYIYIHTHVCVHV